MSQRSSKSWPYFGILTAILLQSISIVLSSTDKVIEIRLKSVDTADVGDPKRTITNTYSSIGIGTPPKWFDVQFDVKLHEVLVPHKSEFWKTLVSDEFHFKTGYQGKVSTSKISKNNQVNKFTYMDVGMEGKTYKDQMYLFNERDSFAADFVAVSKVTKSYLGELPVHGYFGLSPAIRSPETGANSFMKSLYDAKLIGNLSFGLNLRDGRLTLGSHGATETQPKGITWHSIDYNDIYWSLNVNKITLGGLEINSRVPFKRRAVLATGNNEIYGPKDEVQDIYDNLMVLKVNDKLPVVNCSRNLRPIDFHVDNVMYSVPATTYLKPLQGKQNNGLCSLSILPSGNSNRNEWLLGTDFLSNLYAAFDPYRKAVGLAPLR